MTERIARLAGSLEEPLLVTSAVNVVYLTGLRSTSAALLVEPGGRARVYTDFRYAEAARALEGVDLVETKGDLMHALAEALSGLIGFEPASLTVAAHEALTAGGLELVPRSGLVETLRRVKDEGELGAIRRAAAVTSEAYARLAEERFTGRTERELAWRLETLFHELGGEGLAFPVIVAAGPNGARPHALPGERRVESGQTVVVDAGCTVDGYCSDCTRTFATGPLPPRLEAAYAACLEAQRSALAAVRPGADGKAVDAVARELIDAGEFAGAFGHGLGHGVGLDIHEAPRLSPTVEGETLAAGNVVTVEPGIYLEGLGGVRIEDLAVVRDGEAEVLTPYTKALVRVR